MTNEEVFIKYYEGMSKDEQDSFTNGIDVSIFKEEGLLESAQKQLDQLIPIRDLIRKYREVHKIS